MKVMADGNLLPLDERDDPGLGPGEATATHVTEGRLLDFVSGTRTLKDTAKEQVRQRIVRALFHEYGISVEDMELDFGMSVDGKRRGVDIAIFGHGEPHIVAQLQRAVACRPEPPAGKTATRIRDFDQAEKDLTEVEAVMAECPTCRYGMWTNGLEFFYIEKKTGRFDVTFEPIGDWPPADESLDSRNVASAARTRAADPNMLRVAFRRCHNFIHGNEGMPKDAAFWQFLYLIFAKMRDEETEPTARRFWAGAREPFADDGRKAIRSRIESLFADVKQAYPTIFTDSDRITLSDRALAFMVSELSRYELLRTDMDAKGAAYQEIVGANLRGALGQYFTPRGAIKLMVRMLGPREDESVLDPACGTGGFLIATLAHRMTALRGEFDVPGGDPAPDGAIDRLRAYAAGRVLGADFDPFMVKTSQMNMVMAGDGRGNLFHMNSLEFPGGHLADVQAARARTPLGSVDIVMTNPPFGAEIPITDPTILQQYELAHVWDRTEDGGFRNRGAIQASVPPEILFIERCLQWLRPGGRMGVVVPDGILGNPAAEYIRCWILRHAWVLASVDLPVETFIVEANVNILTSLLFLRKKTQEEIHAEDLGGPVDYPVFMAVAEKVGYDRRGNKLWKRHPDGEEIVTMATRTERVRVGGRVVERTLRRAERQLDDDLPLIAERFEQFVEAHSGQYPHLRFGRGGGQ
jgi:type I restriction enzyme M protein